MPPLPSVARLVATMMSLTSPVEVAVLPERWHHAGKPLSAVEGRVWLPFDDQIEGNESCDCDFPGQGDRSKEQDDQDHV